MSRPFLAIAIVLSLSTGALAQSSERTICSEPVNPTCIDSDLTYQDEERIKRCRSDVEAFVEHMQTYVSCLRDKAEQQESRLEALRSEFEDRADDAGAE